MSQENVFFFNGFYTSDFLSNLVPFCFPGMAGAVLNKEVFCFCSYVSVFVVFHTDI